MATTVQVSEDTRERLEEEKDHSRESYDDVIRELIHEREARLKQKIEKAKEQESVPHEEVKEALGIE